MRSGVARSVLRAEVQIEASLSTAAGHATQHQERINHLLNRMERQLAMDHTWPTLTIEEEVTVAANSSTGLLPPNITYTMVRSVWTAYGSQWLPVTQGIGIEQRSLYGPTQRATPISRWEIIYPGTTSYEVWPISAQAEVLRFTGERVVGAMTADASTCLLDADVLVLMCAAEILAKGDPESAQLKLSAAQRRISKILGRQVSGKSEPVNLARRPGRTPRPGLDYIPPS